MESLTIPHHEVERLEALYRYKLLDTLPEKAYDDIISIAAQVCNVPISFISLVDNDRCWFKAKSGLDQEEAPRSIASASHTINQPLEIMVVEDTLADKQFQNCPLVLQNPPLRFYAGTPLVTPDGYAIGTLCVVDNVPRTLNAGQVNTLKILAKQVINQFELRLKMQEVRQLNNKLKESYQDLESFSYSVAHDLRSPIKNIHGFLSLLKEEYGNHFDDLGKELLRNIELAYTNMSGAIDSLWKLSNIGSQNLKISHTNLTNICKEVLASNHPLDRYETHVQAGMQVHGDPALLKIAVENLVVNAVKYSSQKEKPFISIGQLHQNGQALFYIKDNGVGFNDTKAKSIFKPFQRLHTVDEFEGMGIGLSIVHKVIKRHGGKIWAESKPNKGATFYFTLAPALF